MYTLTCRRPCVTMEKHMLCSSSKDALMMMVMMMVMVMVMVMVLLHIKTSNPTLLRERSRTADQCKTNRM